MTKSWSFVGTIVLGVGVALLAGCKKQSSGGDVIKVGEFASLSGSEASFGRSSHNGTLIAIDEINAAGGLLGKKVELITEDNQSRDGESLTAENVWPSALPGVSTMRASVIWMS